RAIFILGPSSSGKTTLCNALAQDLLDEDEDQGVYIREVARRVMSTQGFTRNDTGTYEMQRAIMHAQAQAEIDVVLRLRNAQGPPPPGNALRDRLLLLSDRSAVDPVVYASTGAEVAEREGIRSRLVNDRTFQAVLPLYRRSVFVVLHPVEEWLTDDGVRSLEDPWVYLQELFRTLQELGIPFVEVETGVRDLRERVALVKRCM
ncbi:AAA domain-containing protein, partial [Cristinia sonorae]